MEEEKRGWERDERCEEIEVRWSTGRREKREEKRRGREGGVDE